MTLSPADLAGMADLLERGELPPPPACRELARAVRALAGLSATPDPQRLRRRLLRRIWHDHYEGVARTTAARLIAAAWSAWEPTEAEPLPGTLSAAFARLHRAGVKPLSTRTITDDLDPELYPGLG